MDELNTSMGFVLFSRDLHFVDRRKYISNEGLEIEIRHLLLYSAKNFEQYISNIFFFKK